MLTTVESSDGSGLMRESRKKWEKATENCRESKAERKTNEANICFIFDGDQLQLIAGTYGIVFSIKLMENDWLETREKSEHFMK